MKKGMLSNEVLGVILAAAGIVVLALVLYNLLAPTFNRVEETAESYFDSLVSEIGTAEKGGTGEFSIWQKDDKTEFYVVYFGDKIKTEVLGKSFYSVDTTENRICVCYYRKGEEGTCSDCESLDYPVKIVNKDSKEVNYISYGQNVRINKASNEDYFRFVIQ